MPSNRFVSLLVACTLAASPAIGRAAHVAHAARGEPAVEVGILLFDGVQIIDFSAPYEVFGAAGFGVVTVSADGRPVTTAMGLRVTPDHSFADAPPFDVLLVPGGEVDDARQDEAILRFVRERSGEARHVLSVCTGAHILAGTGLLDGLAATTFHRSFDGFAALYPEVELVRDQRWVDNGRLVTSAGLSSGIDAALHLVDRLRGADRARSVALHLEYDWKPKGGFVRGNLADRYLPRLNAIEWPHDANFERVLSVGDERHWRAIFGTTTTTPSADLLRGIASAMDAMPEWRRDGDALVWRRSIDGKRLRLEYSAQPAGHGAGYELLVELRADDA